MEATACRYGRSLQRQWAGRRTPIANDFDSSSNFSDPAREERPKLLGPLVVGVPGLHRRQPCLGGDASRCLR